MGAAARTHARSKHIRTVRATVSQDVAQTVQGDIHIFSHHQRGEGVMEKMTKGGCVNLIVS